MKSIQRNKRLQRANNFIPLVLGDDGFWRSLQCKIKWLVWTRYFTSARLKFLKMNSTWMALSSAELHRPFHKEAGKFFISHFSWNYLLIRQWSLIIFRTSHSWQITSEVGPYSYASPAFGRCSDGPPPSLFYFLAYFGPTKILKLHGLPVSPFPCFTRDLQVMFLQYYKPCLAWRKF